MEESHTGAATCHMIGSMSDSWNIPNETVHLVLTDNASNMKKEESLKGC